MNLREFMAGQTNLDWTQSKTLAKNQTHCTWLSICKRAFFEMKKRWQTL